MACDESPRQGPGAVVFADGDVHGGDGLRVELRELCENWDMEKYAVLIHEAPEGGFWAEVPALPGCYSQGETMDEVLENVREAITGVLEVMKEQGRQPEPNIQILDVAV